jgi:hypothetical protein
MVVWLPGTKSGVSLGIRALIGEEYGNPAVPGGAGRGPVAGFDEPSLSGSRERSWLRLKEGPLVRGLFKPVSRLSPIGRAAVAILTLLAASQVIWTRSCSSPG